MRQILDPVNHEGDLGAGDAFVTWLTGRMTEAEYAGRSCWLCGHESTDATLRIPLGDARIALCADGSCRSRA